jgi:hypothetical protein
MLQLFPDIFQKKQKHKVFQGFRCNADTEYLVSVQADYSDKYLAECGIPSTTNIHMFRVEKVDLLGNPESGGTFLSTAIDIVKCVYKITVAQAKGSPGNTAYKNRLSLFVNGLEGSYQRINAF